MIVVVVNKLFNTRATSNSFRCVVTCKKGDRGRGGVQTGRCCLIGAGLLTGLCSFLILRDNDNVGGRRRRGGGGMVVRAVLLFRVRTLDVAYAAVIPVLAVVPEAADFATF